MYWDLYLTGQQADYNYTNIKQSDHDCHHDIHNKCKNPAVLKLRFSIISLSPCDLNNNNRNNTYMLTQ